MIPFHAAAAAAWPLNISFSILLDRYVPPAGRSRFAINIGAKDGRKNDPVYELLAQGFGGVAFEGDPAVEAALRTNLANANISEGVRISWGFVTPQDVAPRLAALGTPRSPDSLKLDIDSFDLDVLSAVLNAGFRPKVVMVEINPDYPPPIVFAQRYHANFTFDFEGAAALPAAELCPVRAARTACAQLSLAARRP